MKEVWRYDDEYNSVKKVEVENSAPTGFWLPVLYGSGSYIYCEDLGEIKSIAKKDIEERIKDLQEVLKSIQNIQDI